MPYGSFTWTNPGGVTKVHAYCVGAGGKGRVGDGLGSGWRGMGGGGGASCFRENIAVGASENVVVGAPGGISDEHKSTFKDNLDGCQAVEGANAGFAGDAPGGSAAACTPAANGQDGGNGAPYPGDGMNSPGGGGGSSGGIGAPGNVGAVTPGGAAVPGGGEGGDGGGGGIGGQGFPGMAPGGGGGGGGSLGFEAAQNAPGDGGEGCVVIWDATNDEPYDPTGTVPLAYWGTPPPDIPLAPVAPDDDDGGIM